MTTITNRFINTFPFLTKKSRFTLLLVFFIVNVLISTILRLFLLIKTLPDTHLDLSLSSLTNTFITGTLFDLALFSYFIIPFIFYLIIVPNRIFTHRLHKYVLIAIYTGIIFATYFSVVAEWLFWDEFGVRFNFISVDYLIYRHEVTNNIYESYPIVWILCGIFLLSITTFFLIKKPILESLSITDTFVNRAKTGLILLLLPLLSYLFVDESLKEISDNRYINEIASNGIYQFFYAFKNNTLDYDLFYASKDFNEMSELLRNIVKTNNSTFINDNPFDITRKINTSGIEKNSNIIMISVESLSAKFLGAFGNNTNITPHLDNISKQGILFTNFYATGTRTVRGLEALTLSIPPTPGRSVVKRENNDHLFSFGHVLRQHGYSTKYFYGGYTYFDNMKSFFTGNGYDVIDKSDFTDDEIDFSNAWGMADENLYSRAVKEANIEFSNNKPFFYHIMTTSNHRPYTYPDGKIDIPSGTGRSGAVKYTDYAINQFIESSRNQPWFDNTIFVIVADHCANSAGKSALPINRYKIPLIVYAPKLIHAQKVDILSSQIDVAPTILGLLNISYESRFFGKDILKMTKQEGRALIGNYQRLGLFEENILSYLSPQKRITLIDLPLSKEIVETNGKESTLVSKNVAYYQGANYILKNNINRYESSDQI